MLDQGDPGEQSRKRRPDHELWKKVQRQYSGTDEEKLQMLKTIILRIWELPEEADQLLITISKTGALQLKRQMAVLLASKPSMPSRLWFNLLQNLSQEDDPQVKDTIDPLLQPHRQLAKSIRSFSNRIADQQAALIKALTPMKEIQYSALNEFSQVSFPIEELKKSLEALSKIRIPIQLPRPFLDSVDILSRHNNLFYGSLARQSISYYPPEDEPHSIKASEHPLVVQLRTLQPGKETWSEYQKLCKAILSLCFVPPLLEPWYEEPTASGIHRRDMIFHIPYDITGFWAHVRRAYDASAIIVDCKNYTRALPKDQIVITSKYFGPKKLGNFGIITCRKNLDVSGKKELADRWVHQNQMIICLTDDDLEEMVGLKLAGEDAEYVVDRKIIELRSSL